MGGRGRRSAIIFGAAAALLSACASVSPRTEIGCAGGEAPRITLSEDGRIATTTLSVLTYNIEGLPFPARSRRAKNLRRIGESLAKRQESGEAPDIIMAQEMFSRAAKKAVGAGGYAAVATGPARRMKPSESTTAALPGKAKAKRGEIGLRLLGGGLAIASRYPIVEVERRAYGRKSCAGFDCLSNKGIVLSRIIIPGLPVPIDLYNTHMNARGASKAPAARNLEAHARQALEASEFIEQTHDDANPLIFGGDFNMRNSEDRWANFEKHQALDLVHQVCADPASHCDVRASWDGDAPWMDTQDLQFFWSGDLVKVRPIRVEAMFDGANGALLSDHDGFLVTYELSWPADAPAADCSEFGGVERMGSGAAAASH